MFVAEKMNVSGRIQKMVMKVERVKYKDILVSLKKERDSESES